MKTLIVSLLTISAGIVLTSDVRSQGDQPARTPLQQLQAIRAENAKLIEKQTATLQKLEELRLQAQQLKFLGKRS